MDALVITECDTYPGCGNAMQNFGALLANQRPAGKKQIRNDRYFFIPKDSLVYEHVKNIGELSKRHNRQLLDFFINYNKAENKTFTPIKILNADKAEKLLGKELP